MDTERKDDGTMEWLRYALLGVDCCLALRLIWKIFAETLFRKDW